MEDIGTSDEVADEESDAELRALRTVEDSTTTVAVETGGVAVVAGSEDSIEDVAALCKTE